MKIKNIKPTIVRNPGWLKERFGECVAQISTDTTMKLKSAIKDTFRALYGVGSRELLEISQFTHKLPTPPQGITDTDFIFGYKGSDGLRVPGVIETDENLIWFAKNHPKEWAIVQKCLGLTRNKGRHASAFLISDEPISNFIPITTVGGVRVTQFTANTVESSGGLKMDFLILNSLKDISICLQQLQDNLAPEIDWSKSRIGYKERPAEEPVPGVVIKGRFVPHVRCLPHNGQLYDIWDLPEDQAVFRSICESKTESVFQFATPAARQWLHYFDDEVKTTAAGVHKGLDSLLALANFTALDRPGPLDYYVNDGHGGQHNMLVEYARRAQGITPAGDPETNRALMALIPETFGIITYQEQLTKIFKVLGDTTGAEADEFRVHISKKQLAKVIKDKEVFVKGAYDKVGKEVAEKLWAQMETFANYGFNKSVSEDTILVTCDQEYKAIKDFKAGDSILGVNENGESIQNTVVALHDHGTLPAWEITFDDGYQVTTSGNHKFLTTEGQRPLYEIISRNLGVLCGSSSPNNDAKMASSSELCNLSVDKSEERSPGQGQSVSVRDEVQYPKDSKGASEGLFVVHRDKEIEYPDSSNQTQSLSRAESFIINCSSKDCIQTGNSDSKGGQFKEMERFASRGVCCKSRESLEGKKTIQDGSLDQVQQDPDLGGGERKMQWNSEASGLCVSEPQDLGGSGRTLPFLRSLQDQTSVSGDSSPGPDVESGSSETWGCDVDPAFWRMFPFINRSATPGLAPMAYSDAPLSSTGGLSLRKIVRVRYVGQKRMYDIEVAHPKHNFLLPNGVITSNSHAVAYVTISYACAFLKYHYPLEWWTAVLRNADRNEINEKFWIHVGKYIDLPEISKSTDHFRVVGNRIQAPFWLLKGIGDKAQEQILEAGPFKDIKDFCLKVQQWRVRNSTEVVRTTTDKKTGETVKKLSRKLATTAINSRVISTLIVSGAMDSLFPPITFELDGRTQSFEMSIDQKLAAYEEADKEAVLEITGKKKPKNKEQKFPKNIDPLLQYQMRKAILPAISQNLIPLVRGALPDKFTTVKVAGGGQFLAVYHRITGSRGGPQEYLTAESEFLQKIEKSTTMDGSIPYAVVGYVLEERRWRYAKKDSGSDEKSEEAIELTVDIEGVTIKAIKRPLEGGLPPPFNTDLAGAIVIAILRKRGKKGPNIEDVIVVQGPLGLKPEETSPEPEEES